jgi:hypothetical protein
MSEPLTWSEMIETHPYKQAYEDAKLSYAQQKIIQPRAVYIALLWKRYTRDLNDTLERGWPLDRAWLCVATHLLKEEGEIPADADESLCAEQSGDSSPQYSSQPTQE